MKSGLLAIGALTMAAPVFAQPAPDPLAPLPAAPPKPPRSFPTQDTAVPILGQPEPVPPAVQPPVATPSTPVSTVVVPKDWRGVFDAIDAGNWASAQAGIAALPSDPLTPLAKAELYTAKDSPVVDLASIQALLSEAPELPQAAQLAAMAVKRGAFTPPSIILEKPTYSIGSAPYRYKAKPVLEPTASQLRSLLDPLVKADDATGAEAELIQ